jgi:PelA/Pel-15E family pectate lyase
MRTQAHGHGGRWIGAAVLLSAAAAVGQSQQVPWSRILDQPPAWYASAEARAVADNVLRYQRSNGGWPKDIDMTAPPGVAQANQRTADATIDNGATVTQIRLLDRVFAASNRSAYGEAALRGIDYLLTAQYSNGGWPQVFPLRSDYSRYITFNDGAMTGVLGLLEDLVADRSLHGAGERRRALAADAIARATSVILRAQIRVDGRLTAWCAQHDAVTLEPRKARAYEHVALSGRESVDIVRFLMRRGSAPDVVASIEAAVEWLRTATLHGLRVDRRADPGSPRGFELAVVRDSRAPDVWARFYEIGTNRPIYSGRDGVVHYDLAEIEAERRTGYAWLGPWPAPLLEDEYPAWRARLSR